MIQYPVRLPQIPMLPEEKRLLVRAIGIGVCSVVGRDFARLTEARGGCGAGKMCRVVGVAFAGTVRFRLIRRRRGWDQRSVELESRGNHRALVVGVVAVGSRDRQVLGGEVLSCYEFGAVCAARAGQEVRLAVLAES